MPSSLKNHPRIGDSTIRVEATDILDATILNRKLADDTIRWTKLNRNYLFEEFRHQPVTSKQLGGAATGTAGDVNLAMFPETGFEWHVKGTQTILAPGFVAGGWQLVQDDAAASDGIELTNGITARNPVAFTVGTSGAFFFKATLKVADASGCNPLLVGFRKAEAYQATNAAYADYAALGIIGTADPNVIKITTEAAGGGNTDTDTTMTWADAATKTIQINVSAAGVVTYLINGAAPTVTAAFSFTAGDVVIPYIFHLQAADLAGTIELSLWEAGLQANTA